MSQRQRKYVQKCQRSQGVKDARRQLYQAKIREGSEIDKKWNHSSIQSWLNLMPHCPPPLELLFSTLRTWNLCCQMQQNWPSPSMEQRLYLAASCWANANEEEENIKLKEERSKRCLCNQRKYVQKCQRSQGVKDARRQLCQDAKIEFSESSKKWNRSSIQNWLNPMSRCPPPLELWFQLSALESHVAELNQKKKKRNPSIEQRLYLAASRWAKMKESTRLKQGNGGKSKW